MLAMAGAVPKADEMAHRMAIQDVLAQHSRALDRLQEDWLRACYWPDATVDYGVFKGPAQDFAGLVMPALRAQYRLTRHLLANTTVVLAGSEARTESLVYASHLLVDGDAEMSFHGRYLDRFSLRDGCWKLSHRQVVVDWIVNHPVGDDLAGDAFAGISRGSNDGADPLFALLGEAADD